MLTKKSSYLKGAKLKIAVFKEGVVLVENEIKNQPQNIEYRFIRLSIQEHSPKILKYKSNLKEDKEIVVNGYTKLSNYLKKVIKEYAVSSEIVTTSELNR
mgnify:CR=1 FL=1